VSRFHVLRSRTRFRRYRGRPLPFSYFARPNSFSTAPGASSPVFMFCAPRLVFGGTEGVGYRFLILRNRTRFRQHIGRRVPFSFFALPDSFSAVLGASGPVFIICAPELIFGGTEGVGYRFLILRARIRFRQHLVRRIPFSFFALPDSFSAVSGASGPVFIICAPELVFGGTEGVGYRFLILRARIRFRQHLVRRVPFSFFALPDSFSAVSGVSGPVFMICVLGLIFGLTEGVRSRFLVLRARTHFRRYRERRVPFSCFALPDSFSAVPRASCPVFLFRAPGLIFGDTESVGSRFHVLRAQIRCRRCRGHRVPFSCFALPDLFSAVHRPSGTVLMYCAPGLVFGGT
jgi:hypothetical protein